MESGIPYHCRVEEPQLNGYGSGLLATMNP
jgi:hypothetical protein